MLSSPTHFFAFAFLRLRVVAVDLLVMYLGMFPRFAFQKEMASCIQNRWLYQFMELRTKFFLRIQALNNSDILVRTLFSLVVVSFFCHTFMVDPVKFTNHKIFDGLEGTHHVLAGFALFLDVCLKVANIVANEKAWFDLW